MASEALFLGLDFGTESVRAIVVDRRGGTAGAAVAGYRHGQIVTGSDAAVRLFEQPPPHTYALQHPWDWIESSAAATREAVVKAGVGADAIAGIGVDFTSCTMLPCTAEGRPVCLAWEPGPGKETSPPRSGLAADPHAWPKLWKHHGALEQAERINDIARGRDETWLACYGGTVGLEWFFPKMLEVIERSPHVAEAAEVWLEGGDWLVWQLVGAPWLGGTTPPAELARSTCQAGYKALWSAARGYPSQEFLRAVHPKLAEAAREKMPGRLTAPGRAAAATGLDSAMAARLGLRPGTAVSAAIIDAHAGVPGAGVGEAGTLVMVMGTSGCHMLMSDFERLVPGVAGVVKDGILPGYYGYETGQAAMGDSFEFVRRLTGGGDFALLEKAAGELPPGADGVLCLDWFNGCRTPLMDGSLTGGFLGLRLGHGPEHLYRSVLEASAMGLRWIVDTLREGGVPVDRFVATGGPSRRSPLFMKIVASTLGAPVEIHAAEHGPALGAAILGALAAGSARGGFDDAGEAVRAMAGAGSAAGAPMVVQPEEEWARVYDGVYDAYRKWAGERAGRG
jgi:L-ribulokinase